MKNIAYPIALSNRFAFTLKHESKFGRIIFQELKEKKLNI